MSTSVPLCVSWKSVSAGLKSATNPMLTAGVTLELRPTSGTPLSVVNRAGIVTPASEGMAGAGMESGEMAALPALSTTEPPLSVMALAPLRAIAIPSESTSLAVIVYVNRRLLVPVPETNVACLAAGPRVSASWGEPVTVTV